MANLPTLARTLRFLKPIQILGQLRVRCRRRTCEPAAWLAKHATQSVSRCGWHLKTPPLAGPGPQTNEEKTLLSGSLEFLNQRHQVGWPIKWHRPDLPLLWQYNLHYHEFLWALRFDTARQVARSWIEQHPPHWQHVGWAPYPTSLRLMNWCRYFYGITRAATEEDRHFDEELRASIAKQVRWLEKNLEVHLLGNHLLENAAALTTVGVCFSGDEAQRLYRRGLGLLCRELKEQILDDGMHFERSPMYHGRILFVLLALAAVECPAIEELLAPYLPKMLDAAILTCHPDQGIALLNDSAWGIYNPVQDLERIAEELDIAPSVVRGPGNTSFSLPEAGYYGARTTTGHYLICDAGPVGPDYLPGHAHGDIFSLELSLHGERVVTDTGVFDYGRTETRRICRSTSAHNTVEIDGEDQCEFWDAFKVARRGRPHEVRFVEEPWGFRLTAWHDGYCRLRGRPKHERSFLWHHDGILAIRDRVVSGQPVRVVSRIHLDPACDLRKIRDDQLLIERQGRQYRLSAPQSLLELARSDYFPEFGARQGRPVAVISRQVQDSRPWLLCLMPAHMAGISVTERGLLVGATLLEWL